MSGPDIAANGHGNHDGIRPAPGVPLRLGSAETLEWQVRMREAAQAGITAKDIAAIVAKQVEKALAGDTAAAKFVLNFACGGVGGQSIHVKRAVIMPNQVGPAKATSSAINCPGPTDPNLVEIAIQTAKMRQQNLEDLRSGRVPTAANGDEVGDGRRGRGKQR